MTEPRLFVVDTSVAVKFYVPEDGHEDALKLLDAADEGKVGLIAPSTILAEGFNAIFRQARSEILKDEAAHRAWESLINAPLYTYAPEDPSNAPPNSTSRAARAYTTRSF